MLVACAYGYGGQQVTDKVLQKEVLFLRHKLQKGLLTRDQEPKEEEMQLMSDYVTKLEGFPDLEVSIIRATKINKVLKAILKLDNIPKEDEFKFKSRSQVLLDKWNKLLAVDGSAAPAPAAEANGTSKASAKANGVKEKTEASEPAKAEEPKEANDEPKESKEDATEAKEASKENSKVTAEEESKMDVDETPKEVTKPEEAPEATEKPAAEEVRLPPNESTLALPWLTTSQTKTAEATETAA
jgi:hypothetical protein